MIDVADQPVLIDTFLVLVWWHAESSRLERLGVVFHPEALGRSDRGPIAISVVGDENGFDDPQAIVVWVPPIGAEGIEPHLGGLSRMALGAIDAH